MNTINVGGSVVVDLSTSVVDVVVGASAEDINFDASEKLNYRC